jgi:hypothetical protein
MTSATGHRAGTQQGAGPVLPRQDDHECDKDSPVGSTTHTTRHGVSIAARATMTNQIGPRQLAEPDQVSQVKRLGTLTGADRAEAQHAKHTSNRAEVRQSGLLSWQPTRPALRSNSPQNIRYAVVYPWVREQER